MKLLPPPGPERTRLMFLIGVAVVGTVVWLIWGGSPPPRMDQTTGPPPTSNQLMNRRGTSTKVAPPTIPQALRFAEIEQVPDEPEAGRNLFRFGAKPTPPPPPPPPPTPTPVYTPPAYTPPPIPPVPLKLITIIPDENDPAPTKRRVYLTYEKGDGKVFEHFQGDTVDGRFKLVAVGTNDVIVSYLDGTGRRTLINK